MNPKKDEVQAVPIDKITVPNPRSRGKKKFRQIVANIAQVGLKKPITVARCDKRRSLAWCLRMTKRLPTTTRSTRWPGPTPK